jgi:hypothetical protein
MSSRNTKRRATLNPPDVQSSPDGQTITVDEWVPDYGRRCEVCGETPCVTGITEGKVVYNGSMCGQCTWGDPRCLDPANW